MHPVRPLTITALALAAALSLPACSSGEPAQPAPPPAADPSTTVPQPTAEPAIAFTDVVLQSDVIEAFGAQIVLVRGDTRGMATLYSLAQQNPVTIALDVEPDEAVEGVSWAVEQDQDAEPLAVALVYITTEASGLNATADKIQMRVYDDTGTELSRTDLPSDVTGTPYEPGDFGGAKPSRYLTVMNGTAVFTTELADDTYAVLGYNVASATEKWRTVGPEEPERTGAPLENGWVALDWQDALTAFDPATGNTQWRSEQMSSVYAHGDAPFLTSYASPAAWSGPDPVDFIDGATGAIMSIPDGFTNYGVDPITCESAFLWFASDSSPADKPGLLVRSAEGADVFASMRRRQEPRACKTSSQCGMGSSGSRQAPAQMSLRRQPAPALPASPAAARSTEFPSTRRRTGRSQQLTGNIRRRHADSDAPPGRRSEPRNSEYPDSSTINALSIRSSPRIVRYR